MKRGANMFGWMALLCLLAGGLSAPALAQKGGSGGGGGGTSGGGAGGGGTGGGGSEVNNGGTRVLSTTLTFDDWGDIFNGFYPQGQATFTYSADGTSKSLSIQVSNINVPDGTVVTVETLEQWITPTGNAFTYSYYPMTIHQNRGVFSISTANGDSVMYLTPAAGQTNVYIYTNQRPLMVVQLGHLGG